MKKKTSPVDQNTIKLTRGLHIIQGLPSISIAYLQIKM